MLVQLFMEVCHLGMVDTLNSKFRTKQVSNVILNIKSNFLTHYDK